MTMEEEKTVWKRLAVIGMITSVHRVGLTSAKFKQTVG
jgi:hypothetical protein